MTDRPRLVFHPAAVEEAREARDWYRARSDKAAHAFGVELELAISRILEGPETWPKYAADTRRCLLERFPFSVVYRSRSDEIEVLSVAHAKRRPGYWTSR